MQIEKREIVYKATELYNRYGIRSITMDDLSKELNISKKTLYENVKTKDDIVFQMIESDFNKTTDKIKQIEKSPNSAIEQFIEIKLYVFEKIKKFNPSFFYDLKKYYAKLFEKFITLRRDLLYNVIQKNLIKGKKEKLYRNDFDEEIIAKLHISRLENIYDNNIFTIYDFTSSKWIYELINYHIRGIATNKGLLILAENLKKLNL